MLEKSPVFGGDKSLLDVFGNIGERNPNAPVAGREQLGKFCALAVEHHAHARQLSSLQRRLVGKVGRRAVEEFDDLAHVDNRIIDGLVLAELPVGGVEVGEIDTVKRLGAGTQRLGVVERGRNQIVEVDGLDIECRAHVRAAVAQNLHDLIAILRRVKMRFDRLRLGHDLTESQRSRKYFNQKDVHMGREATVFEERYKPKRGV